MGTLGGFPIPPALWLRRAKLGYANAIARRRDRRRNLRGCAMLAGR